MSASIKISRNVQNKFLEKQERGQIFLATTIAGILAYSSLMVIKSPSSLKDGVVRRLSVKQRSRRLFSKGFLSALSDVLYYYFATETRSARLLDYLRNNKTHNIFIVDEFLSLRVINLKKLKNCGKIIYVSQDVANNRYGFYSNIITKCLMYRFELSAMAQIDLVIACSERDRIKYVEMGAKKTVYYPNIYPIKSFKPSPKENFPMITVISRWHWDNQAESSLQEILKALALSSRDITLNIIGIKPKSIPSNVSLRYYEHIPSKAEYLTLLSKSWIGINVGFHLAGSNERKYDYALSGLVVLSDTMGARGDLLPYEYTFVDRHDLVAKLEQLLQLGEDRLIEMGAENRVQALELANNQLAITSKAIADSMN